LNFRTAILRWANSLSGRLTLSIVALLVTAQLIGVVIFAKQQERERSRQVSESFVRTMVGVVDLFNSTGAVERRSYLETVRAPGLQFWIAAVPAIKNPNPVLSPDAPSVPTNWNAIHSTDKRLIWYPDNRPFSVRYRISRMPGVRGAGGGPPDNMPSEERRRRFMVPRTSDEHTMFPGIARTGVRDNIGPNPTDDVIGEIPPRERPPREGPPREGPPRFREQGPPSGSALHGDADSRPTRGPERGPNPRLTDFNHGPPPGGVPPSTRWRVSILLEDGQWLNAEHLYENGLPPWLRTILWQNGVILLLMLTLVIPVVTLSTQRLKHLARAADKVGRGENSEPLPESGTSEIKQLTHAFNEMSLRLRRFVQGRTEMLAGISHDLRTPITALKLRADLVDDEENRERMLALIDDMQHLTEATLTLARDDSFTEKTDTVDISSLIAGICDDLTDAGVATSADVKRGVILTCRPHSLRRAIRNLAENGAKYGKQSRIHLEEGADIVRIVVDDDGPGIPEDQVEKAFQPFVRLEGSRNRETGGLGLGLAITRSIVLNHGGDLKLVNRPEGGLRAIITLPKAAE